MTMLTTRHVGPWTGPGRETDRNRNMRTVTDWETRARKYNIGARAYLEIWPKGTRRGDPRVKRTPPPRPPALPPLYWRTTPNYQTRGTQPTFIVIHQMECPYNVGVSWLTNPAAKVSAHLNVNEDGSQVTQLVRFTDTAWHARGHNHGSIGIELAGYSRNKPDSRQLAAAARIVAYLCRRYNIRPDQGSSYGSSGVVAHNQLSGHTTNSDVGVLFNWRSFMGSVQREYEHGYAKGLVWGRS